MLVWSQNWNHGPNSIIQLKWHKMVWSGFHSVLAAPLPLSQRAWLLLPGNFDLLLTWEAGLCSCHSHLHSHHLLTGSCSGVRPHVEEKDSRWNLTFMMSSLSSSQRTNTLDEDDRGREVDKVTASWARRRDRAALLVSLAFFTWDM